MLNILTGGDWDQTFSARNWERKRNGKYHLVPIIDILFRDTHHCAICWVYWKIKREKGLH